MRNKEEKKEIVQRRIVVNFRNDNGNTVTRAINTTMDIYQVKEFLPLEPAWQKRNVP